MNAYNPKMHHRRSIRLKGYDYSRAGLYFITICCKDHIHRFGHIENAKMIRNAQGNMIAKWYDELENKFSDIQCHEMIVMPNHFHCIIKIVGADLRVCPNRKNDQNKSGEHDQNKSGEHGHNESGEHGHNELGGHGRNELGGHGRNELCEHVGSPLPQIVQWFKTMTTNEYIRGVKKLGWPAFNGKLWQRNYYEHIIRNDKSYQNISKYIVNNPAKWAADKFNNL